MGINIVYIEILYRHYYNMSGVTSAFCIVAMFKFFIYRISYFVDMFMI